MKTIREIYEEDISRYRDEKCISYHFSIYQPLLDSIGNIVLQVDEDDYQGDSFVLYHKNKQIGLLIFGWGSCSGCDALQACETVEEVEKLRDELITSIIWKSPSKMLFYLKEKDWNLDYGYNEEKKDFIEKAILFLEALKNGLIFPSKKSILKFFKKQEGQA